VRRLHEDAVKVLFRVPVGRTVAFCAKFGLRCFPHCRLNFTSCCSATCPAIRSGQRGSSTGDPGARNSDKTADISKPTAPQTPQQKQLADDTAKLLTLANELKAELDKSTKDTLSLSVIKKAEQVEKLAHKVRDEMKASLPN